MDQYQELISKVLVLDGNEAAFGVLKVFCHENHLIGLRASADNIKEILNSNIDLGAILISEETISDGVNTFDLSYQIHRDRPDLPVFLRRYNSDDLDDIPAQYQDTFTGAYFLSNLEALKNLVKKHLFDAFYPVELVDGIKAVAEQCLNSVFNKVEVNAEAPFLVRDKIMDEFNSLIALESSWCRGYMMLQISKGNILDYIKANKTGVQTSDIEHQDSKAFICNLTNEIWGGINREFMGYGNELNADTVRAQVPIFINPDKRYISFGTEKPQLCYRYQIIDLEKNLEPLQITHKLIFNLDWSPENFEISEKIVAGLIDSGDLELF